MIEIQKELYKRNRLSIQGNLVFIHHSLYLEQLDTTAAFALYKKQSWFKRMLIRLFTKNVIEEIIQVQLQRFFNDIRTYMNTLQPLTSDSPIHICIYTDPFQILYSGTALPTSFRLIPN